MKKLFFTFAAALLFIASFAQENTSKKYKLISVKEAKAIDAHIVKRKEVSANGITFKGNDIIEAINAKKLDLNTLSEIKAYEDKPVVYFFAGATKAIVVYPNKK